MIKRSHLSPICIPREIFDDQRISLFDLAVFTLICRYEKDDENGKLKYSVEECIESFFNSTISSGEKVGTITISANGEIDA